MDMLPQTSVAFSKGTRALCLMRICSLLASKLRSVIKLLAVLWRFFHCFEVTLCILLEAIWLCTRMPEDEVTQTITSITLGFCNLELCKLPAKVAKVVWLIHWLLCEHIKSQVALLRWTSSIDSCKMEKNFVHFLSATNLPSEWLYLSHLSVL